MTSLLFILSLLFLSVSCGKGGRSNGKKYIKITAEQIANVMDNQVMSCGSIGRKACPEGVSRLMILNRSNADASYVCSGFMVNKTTLVTNHHCVENLTECNNTYIAVYDGYGYHQTKCKRIIKTLEDYSSANDPRRAIDYTVMEIEEEFFGNTFSLSTAKASVGDNVTAWVVDHTGLDIIENPNFFESRITEFNCKVQNQNDSASLVLENCPVIHGNSGSPAVNTAGDIVGVIWGATDADVSSQTDLAIRRSSSGVGIVTEMTHFAEFTKI